MISWFVRKFILRSFFEIDLSTVEREIAEDSVADKYVKAVLMGGLAVVMVLPASLFLDIGTLVSVLIPVTMVSGASWFAVSLANVRKKFSGFGLELTVNMFNSFVMSLAVLMTLAFVSLNGVLLRSLIQWGQSVVWVEMVSGLLGIIVMGIIIYQLFLGAVKYDINDAMLTGQNEAAERFYKRSLSFLHSSAENLRSGKGLEVANYYIGVSFYEIFSFIEKVGGRNHFGYLMDKALELKRHPRIDQQSADEISIKLVEAFLVRCVNVRDEGSRKSFENIKDEVKSIKENANESQAMIDTRFSIIFEEIAEMLENEAENLFLLNK